MNRVVDIKGDASKSVLLALTRSGKPMNSVEIMEETGVKEWALRGATRTLRDLGEIVVRDCTSPTCGKARDEYRLTHPLIPYEDTNIRALCIEADKSGDDEYKVEALRTLFALWFPTQDGWKRLYPSDAKRMLRIADGSAVTVYEDLETTGANPANEDDRSKIRTLANISYCIVTLNNKRKDRNRDRRVDSKDELPVRLKYQPSLQEVS